MTLRKCSKEVVEETGYTGVFLKTKQENKMHGQTSKYHLSSQKKKKTDTQVNDCSAFVHMGRCKSLGSLKLLL